MKGQPAAANNRMLISDAGAAFSLIDYCHRSLFSV